MITPIPYDHALREMDRLSQEEVPFLFIIDYECQEAFVVVDPLTSQEVLFDIRGISNVPRRPSVPAPSLTAYPESYESYRERFEVICTALKQGDTFLANLTLATPVMCPAPEELFHATYAPYRLCVPGRFICFSPESFVNIDFAEGRIATYPMKGTIDASLPCAEQTILNDYKETAEHYTIVDLMRSDLARVARRVRVERFRFITEISTDRGRLLQVSSEIVGEIAQKRRELGTLLRELLPAGSISGAPKEATVRAIARAERQPRGFYSGVFGYFDGVRVDSAVAIRFIEQRASGEKYYRSGGGITINSHPEEEYREVVEKIYLPTSPMTGNG